MKRITLMKPLNPRLPEPLEVFIKTETPVLDDTHKITVVPLKKGIKSKMKSHVQI